MQYLTNHGVTGWCLSTLFIGVTLCQKKLSTEEFIEKAQKVHENKYDYSKVEYKGSHIKIYIICPEHGEFHQTPTNHLTNHGCPKCKSKKLSELFTYSFNVFKEKCNKIHNNKYEYFSQTYKNYNSKIKIKHKKCQKIFFQKASSHFNHGCPFCHKNNFSYGELLIESWLIKNNIQYISQKIFKNCRGKRKPLPFNFYLSKYNTCIEFDGKHHFGIGKFAKPSVKINDKIKDEYCKQNNIHLIRIPYFERQNFEKLLIHLIKLKY